MLYLENRALEESGYEVLCPQQGAVQQFQPLDAHWKEEQTNAGGSGLYFYRKALYFVVTGPGLYTIAC